MLLEEGVDAAHGDGVRSGEDSLLLRFLHQCRERDVRVLQAQLEQLVCRLPRNLSPFPLVIAAFGHKRGNVSRLQIILVPRPDGRFADGRLS